MVMLWFWDTVAFIAIARAVVNDDETVSIALHAQVWSAGSLQKCRVMQAGKDIATLSSLEHIWRSAWVGYSPECD